MRDSHVIGSVVVNIDSLEWAVRMTVLGLPATELLYSFSKAAGSVVRVRGVGLDDSRQSEAEAISCFRDLLRQSHDAASANSTLGAISYRHVMKAQCNACGICTQRASHLYRAKFILNADGNSE
jgi:hypothetical protein